MSIEDRLFELRDTAYADFQSGLTPGIERERFIGVRLPNLRKLAKEIRKEEETAEFLEQLPHQYFEENMLHGILLSQMEDYDSCIKGLEAFLPYVDNWAVCDTMSPKVFKKNKERLLPKTKEWMHSDKPYIIRFGMRMVMTHFLDEDFDPKYLELPADILSPEYYVKMMQAWFFATALAKQWDATIPYLLDQRLDTWTHNKTIQKARESYRITEEQKAYLKGLKRGRK